jgi:hypothetical protein
MAIPVVDKSKLVGTVVTRPVWSAPGVAPWFGAECRRHNLVVNLGRSHAAQLLYDASYNHKLKFIQCGTGSVTPSQDNTTLVAPVTSYIAYNSATGPSPSAVGLLKLSWVLLGSVFAATYNLQEFGMFVEDSASLGNPLLVSGVPLMFSRVVLAAPVQVFPWNGTSEKGVAVDWYVQI